MIEGASIAITKVGERGREKKGYRTFDNMEEKKREKEKDKKMRGRVVGMGGRKQNQTIEETV